MKKWSIGLFCLLLSLTGTTAASFAEDIAISDEVWISDDDPLIEDDGIDVVSQEGASWEDIQQAEDAAAQAADEAREATRGLIADSDLTVESANRESLQTYLLGLLDVEDPIGSDGELTIASYIEEEMKSLGFTTSLQEFHKGVLNDDLVDVPGLNVLAERGANSENPAGEIVLICCHYDSKTDPDPGDALANDKSGAAVLLETARILSQVQTDRDICFVFLSGEEDGFYGSLRFAESLNENLLSQIRCAIYVDTVGTNDPSPYLLGTGDGEYNEPASILRSCALAADADVLINGGQVTTPLILAENGYETDNWSYVVDLPSGRNNFELSGITAVRLFQDVERFYATIPSEETEDSRTAPARVNIDMGQLQYVTDVLVQAVGAYMIGMTE